MPPLMNQAWISCLLISTFTVVMSTASETVILSSSVDQCGRTKVCPNENVLYECFVKGPQLVWKIPGIFQQYNQNSEENTVNNTGPVSVWLTNSTNEHLNSTMILTYTPSINNASIECNNKTSLYIIADSPESPELYDPILIGQHGASVYYQLQWSHSSNTLKDLDHYAIFIKGNKENVMSKVFVSALDNKTIISARSGVATTVAITAVNKCGQKSPPAHKDINTTISITPNYIVYILAALAVLFCLLCILLMVIILIFVFKRLKYTKDLMRTKPARPVTNRSDVESHEPNKKSEGFPLLGSRGSDRESS